MLSIKIGDESTRSGMKEIDRSIDNWCMNGLDGTKANEYL